MASTAVVVGGAPHPARVRAFLIRLRSGDEVAHLITLLFVSTILLITILLVFELHRNSALARDKFGWQFLTTRTCDPVLENFGALPFVFGTIVTSAVGLLIAVPVGVGAAIFLAELAPPRISDALAFIIELLAAVPSVIIWDASNFTREDLASKRPNCSRVVILPDSKFKYGLVPNYEETDSVLLQCA